MQPHSCAALTVFTYLHGDLVMAMREGKDIDRSKFSHSEFDIRVQTPSYKQKIYHVTAEGFSRSQAELRLTIGKDYPCRLRIVGINYDADECKFIHDHPTKAYSQEEFRLFPTSLRFEAHFRVPVPVTYGVISHDVWGDIRGTVTQDNRKVARTPFEVILYDTRTNETDPVRRRDWQYHTWVEFAN